MTRITPGTRVRAAMVRASSPASAGVVCIFQFAGDDDLAHGRNHARAAGSGGPARAAGEPSRSGRCQPIPRRRGGRAARRARAHAGPPTGGPSGGRPARTGSPRASRGAPPRRAGRPAAAGEPAVGIERRDRIELATGGADGTLEVRRLGVQHPVQLATERSRHLPRLELEERRRRRRSGAGTSRRPRRSSRSRRPGRGGPATRPAGRRPRAARRGSAPPSGSTTNSRCVRPPARLSDPRARKRPRSHATRQWSAAVHPARSAPAAGALAEPSRAGSASRADRRLAAASRVGPRPAPLGCPVAGRAGRSPRARRAAP